MAINWKLTQTLHIVLSYPLNDDDDDDDDDETGVY